MELEQKLAGRILGALGGDVLKRVEPELGGEFFPQGQRQVGDRVEVGCLLLPQPVEQLVDAVGRFTGGSEPCRELVTVKTWEGGEHGGRLNIGY